MKNRALTIATAALIASITANAQVVFEADFDATTAADFGGSIGYGAQITEANLNAGTAVGTWTVNQAQSAPTVRTYRMIQTDGGADVTEKALRFGIATDGTINVGTAVLTANLTSTLSLSAPITVSFDYGIISFDSGTRTTYMTGLDGSGNRLFQIGFVNSGTAKQMGYFDTSGVWTLIGTSGDLIGNNNTYWNASLMQNVTIEVGASTYDIKLAGATLTGGSGIAFRDASANGLDELAFSANTPWTGGAFDNMTVSQVSGPNTFPLVITPNPSNPGHYDFTWNSQVGKLYDLVSETSLATAPETWPVWQGNEAIDGSAPENTLLNVPGGAGSTRFFAVVEKDPPPLLNEDFESDNGGFTTSKTAGTDWAYGDPNSADLDGSPNPGGSVTEGNGGSTNCWGTDIGNPGRYIDPTTDSCLRSPDFDLTEVSGAQLTFAEALDLAEGDTAVVKLINSDGDVEIATVYTATDGDTSSADWGEANSGNPIDLSAGIGNTVYLQWCLTGTGGVADDYMGWYIDDVVVTGN